ncbi:NPC intracellular cholesterol transporter 2-like [Bolinopsis microptera]|uniref:NPC intracellular cholesterol transporter 2-like n=1 Tax=Bolinopsis microptera TaxID=2820187 RepID=UPI00307AF358
MVSPRTFLFLFFSLCVCYGVDLAHKDCGSTGEVIKVFSEDCADPVCKAKKGHSYQIQMEFKPAGQVTTLKALLYGVISGIPIPFPLPQPDGCVACGNVCPISAATDSTYSAALKVESAYPAIKIVSRWILQDQDSVKVICIEIPVVIIS